MSGATRPEAGRVAVDKPLSPERFAEIAGVSRETLDRLRVYAALLEKWQRTVNLVARSTLDDPWRRHFLDSAQLVPLLPPGLPTITDIGSGAGFPGLVLAIVTGRPTELIEADARKGAFLREAARATGAPATVITARIESVAAAEEKSVDILTARALAPLVSLCETADALRARCCVFLKGAQWQDELTLARKSWKMEVETFASLTEADARILRLGGIAAVDGGAG
jgi:16S rRNA (guanine527-N7)-methyltransferase